jgi:hypothetical protein
MLKYLTRSALVGVATVFALLTASACSSSSNKPAAGKASTAAKPACGGAGSTTAKAADGKFSWVLSKTEYALSYTDHAGTVSQPSNLGWGLCMLTVTVRT